MIKKIIFLFSILNIVIIAFVATPHIFAVEKSVTVTKEPVKKSVTVECKDCDKKNDTDITIIKPQRATTTETIENECESESLDCDKSREEKTHVTEPVVITSNREVEERCLKEIDNSSILVPCDEDIGANTTKSDSDDSKNSSNNNLPSTGPNITSLLAGLAVFTLLIVVRKFLKRGPRKKYYETL